MKTDLSKLARNLIAGGSAADQGGAWQFNRHGVSLRVIASWGMGWDHVSVSLPNRCPSWDEMSWIKSLFFEPTECVMQLHVPDAEHINNHPFCLHLWRPQGVEIPTPPSILVGIK